jgi:hypothetical protein
MAEKIRDIYAGNKRRTSRQTTSEHTAEQRDAKKERKNNIAA